MREKERKRKKTITNTKQKFCRKKRVQAPEVKKKIEFCSLKKTLVAHNAKKKQRNFESLSLFLMTFG